LIAFLHLQDLEELKEQFEKLKQNSTNQNVNEEANERLKNITMEAEKLAKYVEDKMKKIEGTIPSKQSSMHLEFNGFPYVKCLCFRLGEKDSGCSCKKRGKDERFGGTPERGRLFEELYC